MIDAQTEVWINSDGMSLDDYLTQVFRVLKLRLREMEIRHDLTPAERLGHFCTLLRRQFHHITRQNPAVTHNGPNAWTETKSWLAPFNINTATYNLQNGMKLHFNGKTESMTTDRMQRLCDMATITSDDELELNTLLANLSRQIAVFDRKTLEVTRLNRSATELLAEATTAAAEFGG